MTRIKKIGLIGGLGPASTQMYYKKLIDIILKKTGVYPHILINSIPMNELNAFLDTERFDEATHYLAQQIALLKHSGADLIAVSSNTPHIIINKIKDLTNIELISIVDVAVEAVKTHSIDRIGLLGTRFTMQGGFYQKAFSKHGILTCVPRSGHFKYINDKIFDELSRGMVFDETFEQFYSIALELIDHDKVEALLLACTELSLLFKNPIPGVKIIDTAQEHINYIARKALAQ